MTAVKQKVSHFVSPVRETTIDRSGLWSRIVEAFSQKSVPDIARRLGKQKQTVYRWRDGETPGLDTLGEISRSRNVSLHWLLTGEGSKEVSDDNGNTSSLHVPSGRPEQRREGIDNQGLERSEVQLLIQLSYKMLEVLERIERLLPKTDEGL